MSILIGILGLAAVFGLAYLLSNDKKAIDYKAVGIMLVMQVVLTIIMFKTTIGLTVIEAIGNGFSKVIEIGREGVFFVVGGWVPDGNSVFFINVLLIIIFTSMLLSVLTYLRILPIIIKYLGGFLSKITGLSSVTTFHAINNIFFGQSEGLLAIKSHIHKMTNNNLFVISVSSMASVSASIMASYITMLPAKYVLGAMTLNALSALIIGIIIAPERNTAKNEVIDTKDASSAKSIFESISIGALDGGKVALIVAAMLIAYVGLMAVIDAGFNAVLGLTFTEILGYVFSPVAWLMGVPSSEILVAGQAMGTKLATNEFVAMLQFVEHIPSLSDKTVGVVSVFLISFANFSSIGIISGSMQAINGEKASAVSKFGLKMLLAATMVSMLTATLVGLFI
ncbi:NupC/NupG family nucleoside CNT transporter [Ureibacillus aquaedulcis]|uniref:Nucleoside transporter C-terminal domain-containing protein n=1 Tax=Ureibacillus aquaedulcis TaxID=3058421 RepID=A0ABT8GQ81_9BACL|nr:nucleoside transporter C-terminal domain-containing protein [Ureibacillus sp. BA0131]MDN4493555.1 nucleoside transporter C-terminal domain-containing protein [Ureibacillus sp. BA0131]